MKYNISEMVQKKRDFCIVDEVDSILIDESRTPLIISGGIEDKSDRYFLANKFVSVLEKKDFELDEKIKMRFYLIMVSIKLKKCPHNRVY